MGEDKTKTFGFNKLGSDQTVGYLSTKINGTTLINYISGSDANSVHELNHASQVQRGLLVGVPGSDLFGGTRDFSLLDGEKEAYGRQFAFDSSTMPSSTSETPNTLRGITDNYIIGAFGTDAAGKKVFPYSTFFNPQ